MPDATPLPATPDAARAEIERTYADAAHAYHKGDPAATDRMLALHRVIHPPTPDATDGAPAEAAPADTTPTNATEARARIAEIHRDRSHPYHRGDPAATDEMLALHQAAYPDPTPPETPPRTLTPRDLPVLSVPADMAIEDKTALQELVAHSGVDPAIVQAAIRHVDRLLQQPLVGESEAWEGEDAIAEARRRLGDRWEQVREHVHHARLMLRAVSPELYERLTHDPRTQNDFPLFMHMAAVGKHWRNFFASKYGTSRSMHV